MQEEVITRTKDFAQASVYLGLQYPLLRLERGNGQFVVFVFEVDPATAGEIWDRYWRREVQVDAKTLLDSVHELKTRIHSQEGR